MLGVSSSTSSSLRGGKSEFWLFVVVFLLFLVVWHGRGEALPAIVLLAPQEDAYFFPFLEVFLRRTLPEYQILLLHPGDAFPVASEYIVVASSESLRNFRLPGGNVWGILLGEGEDPPFPLLGRIVFSWQEVAQTICNTLCSGKTVHARFVGKDLHPLWICFAKLCGDESRRSDAQDLVVFAEGVSQARPLLGERENRSFFLIALEAATELLFALQEGKIDGVVDQKPSQVAECIAAIVRKGQRVCSVKPLFVTRENIASADAYEVVQRCLSCH